MRVLKASFKKGRLRITCIIRNKETIEALRTGALAFRVDITPKGAAKVSIREVEDDEKVNQQ